MREALRCLESQGSVSSARLIQIPRETPNVLVYAEHNVDEKLRVGAVPAHGACHAAILAKEALHRHKSTAQRLVFLSLPHPQPLQLGGPNRLILCHATCHLCRVVPPMT